MAAPLVICGPSGVGKSVLIKFLQKRFPDKFGFSVSHTTRGPRPGEENGVAYHFSDMETMQQMVVEGKFIEHAEVHGSMYGTSKEAVGSVGKTGRVCILDIDVQGAKSIHEAGSPPGVKFIFVNPPSMDVLEQRLRGRGTETEEKVQKRLANAAGEISFSNNVDFFDHKFVFTEMTQTYIPQEVQDLCDLLQAWFPSLGDRLVTDVIVDGSARSTRSCENGAVDSRKGICCMSGLFSLVKRPLICCG